MFLPGPRDGFPKSMCGPTSPHTFARPRVGDQAFCDRITTAARMHRCYRDCGQPGKLSRTCHSTRQGSGTSTPQSRCYGSTQVAHWLLTHQTRRVIGQIWAV